VALSALNQVARVGFKFVLCALSRQIAKLDKRGATNRVYGKSWTILKTIHWLSEALPVKEDILYLILITIVVIITPPIICAVLT